MSSVQSDRKERALQSASSGQPADAEVRERRDERRQDVQAAVAACEVPVLAGAEVVHEGLVVVVGQHADVRDAGVDDVGKHEIDQPVPAGERDGRHGPLGGQLRHLPLVQPGKQDRDRTHAFSPPFKAFSSSFAPKRQPSGMEVPSGTFSPPPTKVSSDAVSRGAPTRQPAPNVVRPSTTE